MIAGRAAYVSGGLRSDTDVAGSGVSTMAVYAHFGSMGRLWSALRQEGFTRLSARFAALPTSEDPVQDLSALVAAYVENARDHPDLYRVMFDADFDLEDLQAADDTLEYMVRAARRATDAGRFRSSTDPLQTAIQSWIIGHGLVSLVATGPLPARTLGHYAPLLTAVFIAAGHKPMRCRTSVEQGCRPLLRGKDVRSEGA